MLSTLRKEFSNLAIGLTGNPATGKKSVGKELARLTGLELVSLNDLAIKAKMGRWQGKEFAVDLRALRRKGIASRGKIISGHLLAQVIPPERIDFVAILRCSPRILRRRYLVRGYSMTKIDENIESELLDIISFKCLEVYGRKKVAEFDTTRTKKPITVARRIVRTIAGESPREYGIAFWSRSASKSAPDLRKTIHN